MILLVLEKFAFSKENDVFAEFKNFNIMTKMQYSKKVKFIQSLDSWRNAIYVETFTLTRLRISSRQVMTPTFQRVTFGRRFYRAWTWGFGFKCRASSDSSWSWNLEKVQTRKTGRGLNRKTVLITGRPRYWRGNRAWSRYPIAYVSVKLQAQRNFPNTLEWITVRFMLLRCFSTLFVRPYFSRHS